MKISLSILLCLQMLIVIGCSLSKAEVEQKPSISPYTKLFLFEMNKEYSREHFIGFSEEFISKYNLISMGEKYYISGTLTVGNTPDMEALSKTGIIYGIKKDNKWTFRIDINNLDKIININGLKHVEINEP